MYIFVTSVHLEYLLSGLTLEPELLSIGKINMVHIYIYVQ